MRWGTPLLLFAVTLLTRLPFLTDHLWAHDSVLYERAVERFDPLEQRPQPPGYLWYVLLIRFVALATGDANRAMTIVSAVAAAAAVALVFGIAARMFDRRTGAVAALLLMTAVTFWGESAVAYPYTLLAALSAGCALLFWLATRTPATRRTRPLVIASFAWGVAVGFRADLALFLAPLWLLAAWGTGATVVAASALAALLPGVGWLAATAALSGGLARFLTGLAAQVGFVDERYSAAGTGGGAVVRNAYELARYLGRGLMLLALPLAMLALPSARRDLATDGRRSLFLALWALAPLPVYLFLHIGEYGYAFSMLPGLAVLAARGVVAAAGGAASRFALPAIVVIVAGGNAALFLGSDMPLSARDLARRDRAIPERLDAIMELDPSCVLLVSAYDRLVVARYVGERYALLGFDPAETPAFTRPVATMLPRCRDSFVVVLWDDLLRAGSGDWAAATMPHGAQLRSAGATRTSVLRVRDGLIVDIGP